MDAKIDKFLSDFGKNLQRIRKAKGFSTREFAYEADISHSSVIRLEAGLTNPTLTTLIKISEALNVDVNILAMREAKR